MVKFAIINSNRLENDAVYAQSGRTGTRFTSAIPFRESIGRVRIGIFLFIIYLRGGDVPVLLVKFLQL